MASRRPRPGELLTVEQVAALLQLNKLTVYKYIHSGDLPAARLGRSFRVRRADVERFFDARMVAPPRRPGAGRERTEEEAGATVARGRRGDRIVLVPVREDAGGADAGSPGDQATQAREVFILSNPLERIIRGLH